jgi:acyl-CoA dehydrogenase
MNLRAFNEAARALVLWTALQSDIAHRSVDDVARRAADDHVGLFTPVIKGVLTDIGFANTVQAQQVYGGHGYIVEHGVEQFVRDSRIAMIYEGANGIQALDLVGRMLPKDRGRASQAFFREVSAYLMKNSAHEAMKCYTDPLASALGHLQKATIWLKENAPRKPENAGAAATDYMHLFGLVALGYMWCRIVEVASAKLSNGDGDAARMKAKLVTARFFMERMLPETSVRLSRIRAGASSVMELPADAF